ncbi:MAG: hypothetical protein CMI75_08875 [Candidatus Pelagibacter sp.]|nr:hypothetical protein [Candidatus Pelagibacter sp.]
MPSIVILGANGFLGKALVGSLDASISVKAVARNISSATKPKNNVAWFEADLTIPGSLSSIIQKDDIVINLVYIPSESTKINLQIIDNIVNSCTYNKAARLVHCSTVGVVGATKVNQVTEDTTCIPISNYEKNKEILEQYLKNISSPKLDIGILRPTTIIGRGGQNLLKLANALKFGNQFVNYMRACLFSYRPMHLVPVNDVADAIKHLAFLPSNLNKNIYIISADDDPINNFHSVEKILISSLGLKPRFFPVVPFPFWILSFLLRLMGRSAFNMKRTYSHKKIRSINYKRKDSLVSAIQKFSEGL